MSDTTSAAAPGCAKGTPAYTVDSVEGGCRNLRDLIEVICEIRFNGTSSEGDTRLDSLLWVARDLAGGLYHLQTGGAEA